jgi:hypothetical protein
MLEKFLLAPRYSIVGCFFYTFGAALIAVGCSLTGVLAILVGGLIQTIWDIYQEKGEA